jgi:hypothetical protein
MPTRHDKTETHIDLAPTTVKEIIKGILLCHGIFPSDYCGLVETLERLWKRSSPIDLTVMDQMNNNPETPLPWSWSSDHHKLTGSNGETTQIYNEPYCHYDANDADTGYLIHACNAYPKLISMLKLLNDSSRLGRIIMVDDLLKELGE